MQGKPVAPDPEQGSDRAKLLSSVPMRVAKGLKDTIDGPAQLAAHAVPAFVNNVTGGITERILGPDWANKGLDKFTQAVHDIPVVGEAIRASNLLAMPSQIDKDIKQSNAEYEQARQATAPATMETLVTGKREPGMDVARLVGNVVGPGNALIPPAAKATTLAGRVGSGAMQGASAAALQPVVEGDNYGASKLLQVGVGGVAGAVLGPLITKAIDATAAKLGPLIDRLKVSPSDPSMQAEAKRVLDEAFKAQGVEAASVPEAIRKKALGEVEAALKTGGKIADPAQLVRKAEFEALGMEGTLGQVGRDPMQFAKEKNLRGIEGVGEELTKRFNKQNEQLITSLNTRGAAGAKGAYTTGEQALDALQAVDAARKAGVDALYAKAKDNLGRAAPLDARAATEAAGLKLAEEHATGSLPPAAREILNDIATGKIPFNVDTKEAVVKALYRMGRGKEDDAGYAIGIVRKVLDDAPLAEDHGLGQDALNAFRAARTAHAARMDLQDKIPALKAAVADVAPDQFFQKYVLKGDRRDLMSLTNTLKKESPETVEQIKSQILDHLKAKALNGATDEVGVFSQSAYNKALDSIADKLPAFFSKQEIAELGRVGRVASYIQAQPAAAAVNNSNTASAGMNLLSMAGKLPVIGPHVQKYAVNPIEEAAQRSAVYDALNAKPAVQASQESAERIRKLLQGTSRPLLIGAGIAAGNAAQ
jgi:hypothetical protein